MDEAEATRLRTEYDYAAICEGHCPKGHGRLQAQPEPKVDTSLDGRGKYPAESAGWCLECNNVYSAGEREGEKWTSATWSSAWGKPASQRR